jgi:membrane protease YdiL (CAAX protease family)
MDEIEPPRIGATAALRQMPGWLRRPWLTAPLGVRRADAWRQLLPLIALELAVLLLVILPLAELWKSAFHLPDPAAFDKLPHGWLVPLTVLAAPIGEEILFRGWLTGRVRALWLLACAVVLIALAYASNVKALPSLAAGIGVIVLALAAPIGWFLLRKRGTPRWFAKAFPAIFYLVVAGFALMHVSNYEHPTLLILPLVLPQAWIGLMLGYTRMRLGLVHSIVMHMTSNAVVLVVGVLFG